MGHSKPPSDILSLALSGRLTCSNVLSQSTIMLSFVATHVDLSDFLLFLLFFFVEMTKDKVVPNLIIRRRQRTAKPATTDNDNATTPWRWCHYYKSWKMSRKTNAFISFTFCVDHFHRSFRRSFSFHSWIFINWDFFHIEHNQVCRHTHTSHRHGHTWDHSAMRMKQLQHMIWIRKMCARFIRICCAATHTRTKMSCNCRCFVVLHRWNR